MLYENRILEHLLNGTESSFCRIDLFDGFKIILQIENTAFEQPIVPRENDSALRERGRRLPDVLLQPIAGERGFVRDDMNVITKLVTNRLNSVLELGVRRGRLSESMISNPGKNTGVSFIDSRP